MKGNKMKEIKKDKFIKIRVTRDLEEIINLRAIWANLSVSEFIRASVMNSEIKQVKVATLDPEMRSTIYGIANNINQLAKKVNQAFKYQTIDEITAETISKQLYLIDKSIKNLTSAIKKDKQ